MPHQFAGAGGESNHLSGPIDTFYRNHKVIFLSDASASQVLGNVPANRFHYAFYNFSKVSGLYCNGNNERLDRLNLIKQVH